MENDSHGQPRLYVLLEEERHSRSMSYRRFAAYLGLSESAYRLVVTGSRAPGTKFLAGVARTLPKLSSTLLEFLYHYHDTEEGE